VAWNSSYGVSSAKICYHKLVLLISNTGTFQLAEVYDPLKTVC